METAMSTFYQYQNSGPSYFKFNLYTSKTVMFRLEYEQRLCPSAIEKIKQEPSLLSSIEQCLARQSEVFLFSFGSSWSLNVQLMRISNKNNKFKNLDMGIMDLFEAVL